MRLSTEWYGVFLVAGDRIVDQALFPRDPQSIAERLAAMGAGSVLDEERALAGRASGSLEVVEDRLVGLPNARLVPRTPSISADRYAGFGFDRRLLHDAALLHAQAAMRTALSRPDVHIVQAVDALDDITEAANLLSERLREWYALHYPEAVRAVERHEELAGLVSAHTDRDSVAKARPGLPAESMGGPLGEEETKAIRAFARVNSSLYATRADLESYLEARVPAVAPNLARLLGAPLAARMLKLAGGLERLAKLPAGTIQTLGAEKALFRHIVEGGKPPKHGVLLQHPLLHRAPRRERGPLARALAARVAIAARADAFTKGDVAAKLEQELEEAAAHIRSKAARRPSRHGPGGRGPPRSRPPRHGRGSP